MSEIFLARVKGFCKWLHKKKFPELKLMRIQHLVATDLGFKSWSDLLKNNESDLVLFGRFEKIRRKYVSDCDIC